MDLKNMSDQELEDLHIACGEEILARMQATKVPIYVIEAYGSIEKYIIRENAELSVNSIISHNNHFDEDSPGYKINFGVEYVFSGNLSECDDYLEYITRREMGDMNLNYDNAKDRLDFENSVIRERIKHTFDISDIRRS
jgi:hypothetical protein